MKVCLRCSSHFEDRLEVCPEDGAELIATGDDPLIGKIVGGRYRVLFVVGRGSMGLVYKAIQESTGREMAIKVLRNFHETSDEAVKRFKREAKTASSLKHPNIVTLIDFGQMEDGQPYIVTEYLKGLSLAEFIREHGAIPPLKSRAIIRQICDAITEAHAQKIIHRDLKPENIILQGRDQGGRFVKVVDFGVAKLLEDAGGSSGALTMDGKVCGSPAYMSPEQCRGADIDYRTDIYALGIVIFETLTARRPFIADDLMALMFMHVNEPPPKLSTVLVSPEFTPELEAVVRKALSKVPEERQQSAQQLWEEFNNACHLKKKRQAQGSGWIPFSGHGLASVSLVDLKAMELPDALTSAVNEHDGDKKAARRKRLRDLARRTVWLKAAGAAVIVGGLAMLYMRYYNYTEDLKSADTLITMGRPEDAVRILERHKLEGDLGRDSFEMLNSAYLQAGEKMARKHRYQDAVDLLQRVPSKSKYSPEAAALARKFKRKI